MFLQHVCLESTIMFCAVITLCASKWLLVTVNPQVIFEMACLFACVVALVASKRLLPTVNPHVSFEDAKPITIT